MTTIEFLRRQNGISQVELSRLTGINSSIIGQIERGHRRSWPKLRRQLSGAFKLTEAELFDENGWPLSFQ
jgi:putative transcriptional regulator